LICGTPGARTPDIVTRPSAGPHQALNYDSPLTGAAQRRAAAPDAVATNNRSFQHAK
jgi:hypothetical protein